MIWKILNKIWNSNGFSDNFDYKLKILDFLLFLF